MVEITIENITLEFRPSKRECIFHPVPPTFQVLLNGGGRVDVCETCKDKYEKNYNEPWKAVRSLNLS